MMTIQIDWDPKEDTITISEERNAEGTCWTSNGEVYHIAGNWPAIIDDICGCLHDYLEGVDRNE